MVTTCLNLKQWSSSYRERFKVCLTATLRGHKSRAARGSRTEHSYHGRILLENTALDQGSGTVTANVSGFMNPYSFSQLLELYCAGVTGLTRDLLQSQWQAGRLGHSTIQCLRPSPSPTGPTTGSMKLLLKISIKEKKKNWSQAWGTRTKTPANQEAE